MTPSLSAGADEAQNKAETLIARMLIAFRSIFDCPGQRSDASLLTTRAESPPPPPCSHLLASRSLLLDQYSFPAIQLPRVNQE